jgi:predicted Fe-S protein YdhL (DUF1289 family)
MARISTPCVNFCWSDPGHGLCEGCGRTRAEIANWCFITEDERLEIMSGLKARLARVLADRGAAPLPQASASSTEAG